LPSKRYNSKRSFGTRFNDIKETFEVVNKKTPPDQIINDGVDYAQLEVNSIDTTTINYGGISASNFSEGAKIASGESNQRVPSELTDVPYWEQVASGLLELHRQGFHNDEDIQNVEATSEGILFTPTADETARIYLTGRNSIPKSRRIYAIWEADQAVNLRLIWWRNSQRIEVTHSSTTAGVATITTATAHGWSVGKEIRVTGTDVDYDGYHTITAVDTNSISYTSPTLTIADDLIEEQWETRGSVNLEDYVYEELANKVMWDANYRSANVSNKVLTSNLATLTTNATHSFVVGDTVQTGSIGSPFGDASKITAVTDNTISYGIEATNVATTAVSPVVQITSLDSDSATEYAIYLEVAAGASSVLLKSAKVFEVIGYGAKEPLYANVTASVLSTNLVTLTTSAPHGFNQENSVVVSGVGAPYDGTHIIVAAPTTTTFTYTVINANIASNPSIVGGRAVAYDGKQRSELAPDGLRLYQPDGTLAVDLTTAGNSVFNVYYDGKVKASISPTGNATFESIDANSYIVDGVDIVGTFTDATYYGYSYENLNTSTVDEVETENSLLNRLARGSVYTGWMSIQPFTISTTDRYYMIANGKFKLSNNRSYAMLTSLGNLNLNNTSNRTAVLYMFLTTGPYSTAGTASYTARSVIGSGTYTTFNIEPVLGDAISHVTPIKILGARVQSNVVTLKLESDSYSITRTVVDGAAPSVSNPTVGDIVGVSDTKYPYSGYWTLTDNGAYTDGTYYIKYNLTGTALHSGSVGNIVSRTVTTNIVSGTKNVLVANTAGLYPGFLLTKTAGTGVLGASASVNVVTNATHFTTNVNHTTSGTLTFSTAQFEDIVTTSETGVYPDYSFVGGAAEFPSNTPIYWTLMMQMSGTPNVNLNFTTGSTLSGAVQVVDIGQTKVESWQGGDDAFWATTGDQATTYDPDHAGPHSGTTGTVGTTTVTETITLLANQSAYYDNYGRGTSTTSGEYAYRYSLYQGNPGTASGTKKSAVRFPSLTLPTYVGSNTTILSAELYIRNRHSYSASGLTAYFAAHIDSNLEDQTTAPLGVSGTTFTTTFTKGQGKWVTLPASWYSSMTSNSIRGFLLGLSSGTSTWYSSIANYGYFDGYTMSDPPKLRITYQYNA
jgi:hypothetical protein